ncbi:MAG: PPOX class F420-dependent oxidoreductase [Mycobacteriales bacterium]|nr:PPOX class F420-dependent oxidoreductase [Frankia sp.]
MTAELSAEVRSWLDAASFATVATLNADGHPQLSVVWVERDGDVIVFSTVVGRRKERNLRRDPRATMLLSLTDPYRYAEVRGRVTISEEDGRDLIDRLSLKYRGVTPYPGDRGTDNVRVAVRLAPERVFFYE